MTPPAAARRGLAILGNYGNRNLGDEATLATLLQFLERHHPGLAIWALSERPEETRWRHGIAAAYSTPSRKRKRLQAGPAAAGGGARGEAGRDRGGLRAALKRVPPLHLGLRMLTAAPGAVVRTGRTLVFLLRSLVLLRRVRALVIAGGGQISDHFEGVWGFPLQLFTWSLLARAAGARIVVLDVGAGPLTGRASRALFRWTLRLAAHRSYRDERSRRLIEEIGVSDPGPVAADLVFAWRPTAGPADPSDDRPAPERIAGVNVFPFRDRRYWSTGDDAAYRAYLDTLGPFIRWLLEEGYRVRLFPTQLKADTRVIADVMERLAPTLAPELAARLEVARLETVDDLADAVRGVDVVVATRFHAIVMSMVAGHPVLALCNEPKMTDLMVDMGQARHCLPLEGLTEDVLRRRFRELEADRDRAATEIRERAAWARDALARQLDEVFGPLLGDAAPAAATRTAAAAGPAIRLQRPQEPRP